MKSPKYQILITGGAGFLGSHLCERLLAEGHHVTVLDDLSTGSKANLAHLLSNRRLTFVEQDVAQPFDFPVQRIYNLACPASPIHYQRQPVKTIMTNVLGAKNVLELANKYDARVFQASTSEVYGDPEVHPQPEGYFGNVNPVGLRSCYDEGKRCAEALMAAYSRKHRTAVRIARIFNTYGPRMASWDGRVVSNFIVQALRHEPLTVQGDGSQTRSLCYVDDLIDGMVRLMEHPKEVGPINLGNPEELTVLELARTVIRLTQSRSKVVYASLTEDDPKLRRPVIDRARTVLGFKPRVRLEEGLPRTIASFREFGGESFASLVAAAG